VPKADEVVKGQGEGKRETREIEKWRKMPRKGSSPLGEGAGGG